MIYRIAGETESNQKLCEMSLRSFLALLPNAILILFSAIKSNSLIVWVDAIGTLSAELHSAIVYMITRKIRKSAGGFYSFDVSKMELMASFFSDLIMVVGYIILVGSAVYEIISPLATNQWIVFYLIVKAYDTAVDSYFYINQRKIYKSNPSSVNKTELANWRNNLLLDIIIGGVSIVSFFLVRYRWSWYISPVATIILSMYFIYDSAIRLKNSFGELIHTTISIPKQDEIIDILLNQRADCLEKVEDVRCYYVDSKLYIILKIVYKEDTTYKEQMQALKIWSNAIEEIYPNCVIHAEI